MAVLVRNLFIFFIIIFCLLLAGFFWSIENRLPTRDYSELVRDLAQRNVSAMSFTGGKVGVTTKTGERYSTTVMDPSGLAAAVVDDTVRITVHEDYTLYYFQGGLFFFALLLGSVIWFSLQGRRGSEGNPKFARDKRIGPHLPWQQGDVR